MERPTCRTCPYWSGPDAGAEDAQGTCHRHAPLTTRWAPADSDDWRHLDDDGAWLVWPPSRASEFCGEHPDFPAYLAGRKTPAAPPATTPVSLLKPVGKRLRDAIRREGIEYAEQFAGLTADDLLEWRGVGITSLYQLRAALAKHGIKLLFDE